MFLGWALICHNVYALSCFNRGLPPREIASLLGWQPSCGNICGGYFKEPVIILACHDAPDYDAATTTITADNTVLFSAAGTSRLQGNVTVLQPGRKMQADEVILYRNPNTNEIAQLLLKGNVHYFEPGKHLVAGSIFVDLEKKYARVNNVLYRLAKDTRRETLNAWGQAETFVRRSNSDISLTNASYTTCSPVAPTWQVIASKLHINRDAGWGEAINTFLLIHKVAVLWVPYFSFPTDDRRKSGFLFPTAGYSSDNGLRVSLPYYLNLAPNYDATIVPSYLDQRGFEIESHFRYLTHHSSGNFSLEYMPYDRKFASFRANAPAMFGVNPDTIPFLNRLENDSNSRGRLSLLHQTHFDPHWWGNLRLNYVTDDYYLQDFAFNPFLSVTDQLINQAELHYASDNWRFIGRLQTYQTLHPINQQPILDQYSRLPQLFLFSDYPERPNHINGQIATEYVYFDHPKNFFTGESITTGQRFHLQPWVNYPLISDSAYFIPKLQLPITLYDLHNTNNYGYGCNYDDNNNENGPSHITRALPVFNIDSGVYLERCYRHFTQTLEPRLFYLFVPYVNQNDIPIFDTTLPPFSVAQLFRTNRFVGYDRFGDANQISFALTTRFLDSATGEQRLIASVGQTLYITPSKVGLTPNCNNDFYTHKMLSPFVGELGYMINCNWDGVLSFAMDPDDQGLNNASLQFHYRPDPKHIFNVGYDFVRKGDTLTTYALNSSENNLSRINISTAWQLNDHWQALANMNYNLSHGHPEAYFYGFQYDSCCWAMRIVASRIITAESNNDVATFQSNYYVQLQLKGLGNVGNSDPGGLLTTSIFGYQDTFRG